MRIKFLPLLLLFFSSKANSYFIHLEDMTQSEFASTVEELGILLSMTNIGGFDTMGLKGISMSFNIIGADITPSDSHWKKAFEGKKGPEILPILRFDLEKGFPHFDLGLHITSLPGSQILTGGIDLEYEIIRESIFRPSWTFRTSYSTTLFSEAPHLYSITAETGISKRKAGMVYYVGLGGLYSKGNAKEFSAHDFFLAKGKLGITFHMGFMKFTLQADISSIFIYTFGIGGELSL